MNWKLYNWKLYTVAFCSFSACRELTIENLTLISIKNYYKFNVVNMYHSKRKEWTGDGV